jgi:hypothetical protein
MSVRPPTGSCSFDSSTAATRRGERAARAEAEVQPIGEPERLVLDRDRAGIGAQDAIAVGRRAGVGVGGVRDERGGPRPPLRDRSQAGVEAAAAGAGQQRVAVARERRTQLERERQRGPAPRRLAKPQLHGQQRVALDELPEADVAAMVHVGRLVVERVVRPRRGGRARGQDQVERRRGQHRHLGQRGDAAEGEMAEELEPRPHAEREIHAPVEDVDAQRVAVAVVDADRRSQPPRSGGCRARQRERSAAGEAQPRILGRGEQQQQTEKRGHRVADCLARGPAVLTCAATV